MQETTMTESAPTTTESLSVSQGSVSQQPQGSQQAQSQQAAPEQAQPNITDGKQGQQTSQQADVRYGSPENYDFKPPEGRNYDPEVMKVYTEVAKELNLSQDAAQKLLSKLGPPVEARQARELEQLRTVWTNDSKADTEFGGERLTENLAIAKKSLDQFGTPGLLSLLNESGLGNHPEIIRFFYRAGKAIGEDKFVGGGQGGKNSAKSNADYAASLYPTQQQH